VSEGDAPGGNDYVRAVREIAAKEGARVVTVSAAVEAEVAQLDEGERKPFLEGLGLSESGLTKVIHEGYALLTLVTFYTAGPKEVHAWTVPRGTPAPAAAGVIHSDFQKGFIRAEIIKSEDLIRLRSEAAARDSGLLAVEGKDYLMQDGDIAHFRFNVSTG
jgi:ribosome-binding ATPase YchF (GTP1/OBG family)